MVLRPVFEFPQPTARKKGLAILHTQRGNVDACSISEKQAGPFLAYRAKSNEPHLRCLRRSYRLMAEPALTLSTLGQTAWFGPGIVR